MLGKARQERFAIGELEVGEVEAGRDSSADERVAARGESRGGLVFDVPTPQKSAIFESFFRPKLPRMTFTTGW